jgi:hypothetical protein
VRPSRPSARAIGSEGAQHHGGEPAGVVGVEGVAGDDDPTRQRAGDEVEGTFQVAIWVEFAAVGGTLEDELPVFPVGPGTTRIACRSSGELRAMAMT